MRKVAGTLIIAALVLLSAAAGWAVAQANLAETGLGYLQFASNELTVGSKVEDPPKVRMTVPAGNSLGALSFNRTRPDGVQEEVLLLQGKLDEQAPQGALAGCYWLGARKPFADGDAAMVHVADVCWDRVVFHVPTNTASASTPNFIRDTSGRYVAIQQEDGNLVVYDTRGPGGSWVALWSWMTGVIQ